MTDTPDYDRLMPVAKKAVRRMAGIWGLSDPETDSLLSGHTPHAFPERAAAALCAWKHVSWRFRDNGAAWLRIPNAVYGGSTPLNLLISADLSGPRTLRAAFERAESEMVSGYAVPEYPVADYACETADGGVAMITTNLCFADAAVRTDGGPGRFATETELDAALAATDAVDAPVISYLRDK